MKKMALILALCVAAPLYAATVSATFTDNGDGTGTLTLDSNGDPIVAVALTVDADAAVEAALVDPLFNIYMDAAYSDETATPGSYVYGTGTCQAVVDAAGELPGPQTDFAISAGMLNGEAVAGADGADVVEITITGVASGTISANALRGGVVDVNGNELDLDPASVAFSITSGPACWSNPNQALGDANEDGFVDGVDVNALIAAFGTASGSAGYDACADFSRDGFVDGVDVNVLIANFGSSF